MPANRPKRSAPRLLTSTASPNRVRIGSWFSVMTDSSFDGWLCALAYGLFFDSSILVKIFDESESEFKSVKPGKRILVSPADKLDLPKKKLSFSYFRIRKKN